MYEIPKEERPYEKYLKYGIKALTDKDLLAVLLRTGTREYNVEQLAYRLLTPGKGSGNSTGKASLMHLYQLSYEELQKIRGIGKVKALQIVALLELSRRIAKEKNQPQGRITTPDAAARFFMEDLRHLQEEYFLAAFLDAKCHMTGYQVVSKGSLTSSVVHPREVYKAAISRGACSIIVLHNHPSGDPTPSKEDIGITRRLKETGDIVGIPLLDHVIIGDGNYLSLKEESYI